MPDAIRLARAEAAAVGVGRRDAARLGWEAVRPISRLARLLLRATGADPVRPFADDRLEALRLFAAMLARNDRRAEAAAARLLGLGFSAAQLHQAIRLALA